MIYVLAGFCLLSLGGALWSIRLSLAAMREANEPSRFAQLEAVAAEYQQLLTEQLEKASAQHARSMKRLRSMERLVGGELAAGAAANPAPGSPDGAPAPNGAPAMGTPEHKQMLRQIARERGMQR